VVYFNGLFLGFFVEITYGELICNKTCKRAVATVVIIVALALAIVVSVMPEQLTHIIL